MKVAYTITNPTVSEDFEKFRKRNGLLLDVTARRGPGSVARAGKYYARFYMTEIMENGMLRSGSGDGTTPEEAIRDYANGLAGKRIVYNAMGGLGRREVQCPDLFTVEF